MIEKKLIEDFARAMVKDLHNSGFLSREWKDLGELTQQRVANGVKAGFRSIGVKVEGDKESEGKSDENA